MKNNILSVQHINSKEYWEYRFAHDWEIKGGPEQTNFFTSLIVNNLPLWLIDKIKENHFNICDVGCGEGEMVNIFKDIFPGSEIFGIDFSQKAIEKAKEKYPQSNFSCQDLENIEDSYDVIIISNTLEHFENPFNIITKLLTYTNKYLVILVPFKEYKRIDEHFYTFDEQSFPLIVGNFSLTCYKIINCSTLQDTLWPGDQILVVYSDHDIHEQLNENKLLINQLIQLQQNLNSIYSSDFWKIANRYYKIRDHIPIIRHVYKVLQLLRTQGFKALFIKVKAKLYQSFYNLLKNLLPVSIKNYLKKKILEKNISHVRGPYEVNQNYQFEYLLRYFQSPVTEEINKLKSIIVSSKFKKVVLYPLSYPLKIKQRPEHILRSLAKKGHLCLILSFEKVEGGIKKIDENLYVTDLIGGSCYLMEEEDIILLISYCYFVYLRKIFKKYFLIYDVLDELNLTSHFARQTEDDHKLLLEIADISLFSSTTLYEKNHKVARNPILMENGVNVDDFRLGESDLQVSKFNKNGKINIGYFGVISELLDFDILYSILKMDNIQLILIGPVNTFFNKNKNYLDREFNKLRKYENFIWIDFVEHQELKYYLKDFDICIIPFKINEVTDSVSPVKLFEYMTSGKPIVCTPIKELKKFEDKIFIADVPKIHLIIDRIINSGIYKIDYSEILVDHGWDKLVRKLDMYLELPYQSQKILSLKKETTIDILNISFFDWEGKTMYRGGAERYVIDLAGLIKKMGYNVRIIQNGNHYFEKVFQGFQIIGMASKAAGNLETLYSHYLQNYGHSKYVICSPFDIACKISKNRVIGINHGIHWDGIHNKIAFCDVSKHNNLFEALKNVETCVCVDTNFINWVRTYDHDISSKLVYIPNYYNPEQFTSHEKDFSDGEIIILYPRRLYPPRGLYLVLGLIESILNKWDNVKFHFIGQVSEPDKKEVEKYLRQYPNNVNHYSLDMSEMQLVYNKSQIVLIPTVQSEGTSLSCIEAMATNNAIIATNVGGLPNLIIDGFNGLLVSPNIENIANAIMFLLDNREERIRLASNALETAKAFNKTKWEYTWSKILHEFIN